MARACDTVAMCVERAGCFQGCFCGPSSCPKHGAGNPYATRARRV